MVARAATVAQRGEHAREHVGDHVIGGVIVLHEPSGRPPRGRLVAAIQLVEGAEVALTDAVGQVFVEPLVMSGIAGHPR